MKRVDKTPAEVSAAKAVETWLASAEIITQHPAEVSAAKAVETFVL